MRWLFVRPSPQLRVRCAIAAAQYDLPAYRYCRRVIEDWLNDEAKPLLQSVPDEAGPFHAYRYPVKDEAHRTARMIACDVEISLSTLVIRILHAYVPFEVEVLAAVIGAPLEMIPGPPTEVATSKARRSSKARRPPIQQEQHHGPR